MSANYEGIRDYWVKKDKHAVNLPSDYKTDYYPINIADKVNKPCFMITGALDKVTPPEGAEEIYAKLAGEKEIWIVRNAGHGVEWD
ncbi:MAG: acetylxylan esterase [Bacteroidetes bacterium]|nr:acetylxylan esterase [Bacteroidota bacterium]